MQAAREKISSADAALDQGQVGLSRSRFLRRSAASSRRETSLRGDVIGSNLSSPTRFRIVDPAHFEVPQEVEEHTALLLPAGLPVRLALAGTWAVVGHGKITRIAPRSKNARSAPTTLAPTAWLCRLGPT